MSSDINVQTFSGKVNINNNLLVGSSHLFVDTVNNRVGITTADPDAGLHVNSNAYVHTDFRVGSGIVMNDTTGQITAGSFVGDGSAMTGINSDSGSWVNGTNSNVHLATSTDSVGIGTTSPDKLLHVETPVNTSENLVKIGSYMNNGSRSVSGIEFATNPQFFNGDNGQRVPAKIKAGFYGDGPLVANWADAYISLQTTVDNGGLVDNLVCRGGNVGIRKTDPLSLLDIKVSSTSPAIRFSDSGQNRYACGIGGVHVSNEGQRLDFYVGDSGSNTTNLDSGDLRMSIKHNGNVGIGTSDPLRKFHVFSGVGDTSANWISGVFGGSGDYPRVVMGSLSTYACIGSHNSALNGWADLYLNNPTNSVVVKTTGKVGIGTSDPGEKLHVDGIIKAQAVNCSGGGPVITCTASNPGDMISKRYGSADRYGMGQYAGGVTRLFTATAYSSAKIALSGATDDVTGSAAAFTDYLTVVASSGNVGIGTTSPEGKLHIDPGADGAFMIGSLTATQATAPMVMRDQAGEQIHFYYGTTKVGSITSTGTNTAFNTSSDYRLKENIMELTSALDRVNEISVYQFNFISEPTRKVNGFIAHELQSIIPEAVTGVKDEMIEFGVVTRTNDGTVIQKDVKEPEILDEGTEWSVTCSKPNYQGVDQSKVVPLLTRSIQELSIKNDTLETQLTSVLARLDALENA